MYTYEGQFVLLHTYGYVGSCVKINSQTYIIREGLILPVTLSLSLAASYDIGVNVYCVDLNASELSAIQYIFTHNNVMEV